MEYSEEMNYKKEAIAKLKGVLRHVSRNAKDLAFYDDINRSFEEIKKLEIAIRSEIQNIFNYFEESYDV